MSQINQKMNTIESSIDVRILINPLKRKLELRYLRLSHNTIVNSMRTWNKVRIDAYKFELVLSDSK